MLLNLFLYILFGKEELQMVDLYTALVIAGRRTIDKVPERYREAVIANLAALGLDENGNDAE